MKISADIRQLYKPIQPTVKQSADNVTYSEFLPDIRLQNYIYCYWQLKTTETLSEPFIYRVVADGCIDIFFELNNPKDNFVMGFCKKFTEFPLDNSFHNTGNVTLHVTYTRPGEVSLFFVASLIFVVFVAAKTLVSAEKRKVAEFNDYYKTLLMFVFSWIGLWFIQPRVKSL